MDPSTLTLGSLAALFGAMALLAAVPSTSVLIVTSRAAANGFAHGAWVSLGVVVGDLLFIAVAMFGLMALIDALGPAFVAAKVIGALYLLWLARGLWRMTPPTPQAAPVRATATGSVMAGLTLTLGDQKAVLFYLGFLPAFVPLTDVETADVLAVMLAAAVAVGGVKLAYAAVAARGTKVMTGGRLRALPRVAAVLVAVVGVMVLASTVVAS
ncbi:LysE family translocator [Polycyclovorans algicola]|uniref:LysE family translocator n=1 Tax=Polycyclovorans algicola TaxID=616992 RepID=UPI0004A7166F|nr:LysE family translocator [Polycyclovorans algicola]